MAKITNEQISTILSTDGSGITLARSQEVTHKKGYQVGITNRTAATVDGVREAIKHYNGGCGLWVSGGVCYVDKSIHIKNKIIAHLIGKIFHQQSIYNWATGECDPIK